MYIYMYICKYIYPVALRAKPATVPGNIGCAVGVTAQVPVTILHLLMPILDQ